MLREYSIRFRAMGTDVAVLAVDTVASRKVHCLLEQVSALFRREEARFSRFCSDSELMRLNGTAELAAPSPQMWDVLLRCRGWWETTQGVFDPTVLDALESAGYVLSFEATTLRRGLLCRGVDSGTPTRDFGSVVLTSVVGRRTVCLRDGVRLDMGGIVKGWTVDRAAELLDSLDGYLIDAGGDVFARGDSIDASGWCVAIEDFLDPDRNRGYVFLKDGALAMSGTYRRRWRAANGGELHHLIDHSTGTSAVTDVVSVSLLGSSVESCEVLAKVALIRGSDEGMDLLEGTVGVEGYMALADGSESSTAGWPGYHPPAVEGVHHER